jgi:hypothetical protein
MTIQELIYLRIKDDGPGFKRKKYFWILQALAGLKNDHEKDGFKDGQRGFSVKVKQRCPRLTKALSPVCHVSSVSEESICRA